MRATLLLVSGLSGAGKTTLVRAALQNIPYLTYLRTTTTRPLREDEKDCIEYAFVSDDEYQQLRHHSKKWDHTEFQGYSYGADVEAVQSLLKKGISVICTVAPDKNVIESMGKIYGISPITVWIDTPPAVAKSRVMNDKLRSARNEISEIKHFTTIIFTPTGNLQADKKSFTDLVSKITR